MLNIGTITAKKKEISRDAFYESRWRNAGDHEAKQYDKSNFGLGRNAYYDEAADLTEQILSTYNTCGNERRSRWMSDLAKDSLAFIADVRGTKVKAIRLEAILNQSIARIVGQLYSVLRGYAYEYNHSIGWNELYITCSKPCFVTEVLRYNLFREPLESITNFRTRLSTRTWSLVVRGQKDTIDIMLVPIHKVIGLSKTEKEFQPIMTLKGQIVDDTVQWNLHDQPLLEGQLESLAMEVFSALVNKTKETIQTMDS